MLETGCCFKDKTKRVVKNTLYRICLSDKNNILKSNLLHELELYTDKTGLGEVTRISFFQMAFLSLKIQL